MASAASSAGGSSSPPAAVPGQRPGPKPIPVPDVDAEQLLHSLGLDSTADPKTLLTNLRKLPGVRQQGALGNAAAVAAHLLSPAVGLTARQAGQLLERCPVLFGWPPEQRAAVLFGDLMAAGLTAAEAAKCFAAYPSASSRTTLAPGLAELAAVLAHSQDRQDTSGRKAAVPAAQRTVAALLRIMPSAVRLVSQRAGYLQQRAVELQRVGFTAVEVAAVAWRRPELLWTESAAKVASRAAVLQQELGVPAEEVISLAARTNPRWLSSSLDTLQQRAAALAEGFGKDAAAAMLLKNPPALNCGTAVWRRNLSHMAACGVADPKAVLRRAPTLLHVDHAAPGFLQRRLLLQRGFGLTAAQLYELCPSYLVMAEPQGLAQRLKFVEQRRLAHRLLANAAPSFKQMTGSPRQPAITVRTVGRPLPEFLAAVGASQAEWEAWATANPPAACPLYGWAQQAAGEEAARLAAALPAELAQHQ